MGSSNASMMAANPYTIRYAVLKMSQMFPPAHTSFHLKLKTKFHIIQRMLIRVNGIAIRITLKRYL